MEGREKTPMEKRASDFLAGYMSAACDSVANQSGEALVNGRRLENAFVEYVSEGDEIQVQEIIEARRAMRLIYGITSLMFGREPGGHN